MITLYYVSKHWIKVGIYTSMENVQGTAQYLAFFMLKNMQQIPSRLMKSLAFSSPPGITIREELAYSLPKGLSMFVCVVGSFSITLAILAVGVTLKAFLSLLVSFLYWLLGYLNLLASGSVETGAIKWMLSHKLQALYIFLRCVEPKG